MRNNVNLYASRASIVDAQLAQYDYTCSICGKPVEGADQALSICAGWDNGKMLMAHRACWQETHPEWEPKN